MITRMSCPVASCDSSSAIGITCGTMPSQRAARRWPALKGSIAATHTGMRGVCKGDGNSLAPVSR